MIEPVIETGWTVTSFRDVITAGRRLLLRPHGKSEERVWRGAGDYWIVYDGKNCLPYFPDTRAKAAQAAHGKCSLWL